MTPRARPPFGLYTGVSVDRIARLKLRLSDKGEACWLTIEAHGAAPLATTEITLYAETPEMREALYAIHDGWRDRGLRPSPVEEEIAEGQAVTEHDELFNQPTKET